MGHGHSQQAFFVLRDLRVELPSLGDVPAGHPQPTSGQCRFTRRILDQTSIAHAATLLEWQKICLEGHGTGRMLFQDAIITDAEKRGDERKHVPHSNAKKKKKKKNQSDSRIFDWTKFTSLFVLCY
jgi:hypothetical protein